MTRTTTRRTRALTVPKAIHAQEHGLFFGLLKRDGLPLPETEFVFHPSRRWRMDFAWVSHRVFLECDGAIWTTGRHTRGKGWLADTEKLNTAAAMGWRHLRCSPQQLHDLALIATIRETLNWKPA